MHDIHYGRKRSAIKRALNTKLEDWLDSITDESVRKTAAQHVIVTGGAIASMLIGDPINDYDLYFNTKESTIAVARYYVDVFNKAIRLESKKGVYEYEPYVKTETIPNIRGEEEERVTLYMKSAGIAGEDQDTYDYFETHPEELDSAMAFAESTIELASPERPHYRPVFLSQNAITLATQIQLIIRFYGDAAEIHKNFDFAHARCWYDYSMKDLQLPLDALEALLSRQLIYTGSLYPIASIFRMKKFIERGWRITAGQQLKIMWQISELDLQDMVVLRDQLTGVDMAYLHEVIDALKNVQAKSIDSTYVAAIIDRIFD